MIWFTSDWHLGHTNIAGPKVSKWPSGYRDFDSTDKMDRAIIDAVNKYVKHDDILYNLGDICFAGKRIIAYRHAILCQTIHLCRGNHDKDIDKFRDLFTSIEDVQKLSYPPVHIFMSHYSHRVWPASHKGSIHLYGHSHDNIEDHGKSMDVGVDVAYRLFGEYRPFSMDDIMSIMNKKQIALSDGHGKQGREQ